MDAEQRRNEALQAEARAEVRGRQRSTWLIGLGVLLFFAGGASTANNPDAGPGGVLFAVLGVGLIVAGIVIRPRS